MFIYCTKKVSDRLMIPLASESGPVDPLFSWRLNVAEDGYDLFAIFVNDATRFSIVIRHPTRPVWDNLEEFFVKAFREYLLTEQINPDVIESYLEEAGSFTLLKNTDKHMTGRLNIATKAGLRGYPHADTNEELCAYIDHEFVRDEEDLRGHVQVSERFFSKLQKYGLPVRKSRAYELSVRLLTVEGWVRRELLVPANITFESLRSVIDLAYNWGFSTAFRCFAFFGEGELTERPDLMLFSKEDKEYHPSNAKLMSRRKLSELLDTHTTFWYYYDGQEIWRHLIDVKDTIDECLQELPILVSGEGDAPPRSVGGMEGFADVLYTIKFGSLKAQRSAKKALKEMGFEPFDLENVKRRVKRSLRC